MYSISRRGMLLGALATGCGSGLGVPPAKAGKVSGAGCALIGHAASAVDIDDIAVFDGANGSHTTGQPQLDASLDRALKRIADCFEVLPAFAFFDDSGSPNAYALDRDVVPGRRGAVLFGRKMFAELMELDGSGNAVMMVAAHEFGHIRQYASGKYSTIQGGRPTDKRTELHADFLSGYYIGLRKSDHPTASFWKAGKEVWEIGDLAFNNAAHHGTPRERVAAAEAGFKVSFLEKRSFSEAFNAGQEYVIDL